MSSAISNVSVYLLVALGGGLGASLRFYCYEIILNWLGKGFPFATLTVNICGSLLMGTLYALIEQGIIEAGAYRPLIGIGFLGAFTTFSTFSVDSLLLIQQGEFIKAMLNIVLNVCLCISAAAIGMYIVSLLQK